MPASPALTHDRPESANPLGNRFEGLSSVRIDGERMFRNRVDAVPIEMPEAFPKTFLMLPVVLTLHVVERTEVRIRAKVLRASPDCSRVPDGALIKTAFSLASKVALGRGGCGMRIRLMRVGLARPPIFAGRSGNHVSIETHFSV